MHCFRDLVRLRLDAFTAQRLDCRMARSPSTRPAVSLGAAGLSYFVQSKQNFSIASTVVPFVDGRMAEFFPWSDVSIEKQPFNGFLGSLHLA